ncbi:hypothetical protein M436DRAFT_45611 [Aureobasidium namibiae CBS 147.97]|uniref:Uncharacterized protein n=1 Tax=Aureobasidium namibiae CBS 147.97 TaxID=1043004 RepID=A0A074WKX4_9PEZI
MGDIPGQWALLALASAATQASTNSTSDTGNNTIKGSNTDWLTIFKGFLPMLTLILGFPGQYLLSHFLHLMTHLSEIETPLPGGVDSQDSGSEKYGLLEQDDYKDKKRVSAVAPKSAYLTSSIRATVRHLNAEAGDLSMFRGIGSASAVYLVMIPLSLCIEFVSHKLPLIKKSGRVSEGLANHITSLVGCQMLATLIHVCISKPRYKFWFRRMPMTWLGVLRTAWVAIIVNGLTDDLVEAAFYWLTPSSKPGNITIDTRGEKQVFQLSNGPLVRISIAVIIWSFFKSMLRGQIKPLIRLVLLRPFEAIETRVYASMLRDDEDPVIPMDRNFQGRPQSGGILQQSPEPLGFVAAAKTIDKKTYIRLVKLKLKVHVIETLITWAFWTLIFAETVWFFGPSAIWVVVKLLIGKPVVQSELDAVAGNVTRRVLDSLIAGPAAGNFTSSTFNMTVKSVSLDQ